MLLLLGFGAKGGDAGSRVGAPYDATRRGQVLRAIVKKAKRARRNANKRTSRVEEELHLVRSLDRDLLGHRLEAC
jgi:hypothetical protein